MAKKIVGWALMALIIIAQSVVIGLNGQYIFSKDKFYTQKEVDVKVEEAYQEGVNSHTDLLEWIAQYKAEAEANKTLADNLQIELNKVNADLETALSAKKSAEDKIVLLDKQIADNNLKIQQNEDEIARLQARVSALEESGSANNAEIVSLNSTINSLRQTNASLQETNASNLDTISSLNATINSLNAQISNLNTAQSDNLNKISALNEKISQLQASISYYENYLKTLENENKVVLTFEYNNSVINIQVVNKGSKIAVSTPANTDKITFNGWKNEAGETVDFETYTASKTEKFTANLTFKHKVDFVAFGEIVETQYVKDGGKASVPSSFGTKPDDGFSYSRNADCYSLDNVHKYALSSFNIVDDTVIYIVYEKRVTIYFGSSGYALKYGDNVYDYFKKLIKETDYKKFKYFTFEDGSIISEGYTVNFDVPSFKIFANYANFFDVTFEIDGVVDTSRSQIVEENKFAVASDVVSTPKHYFDGWYVGDFKVDVASYPITKNTTFVGKFIDRVEIKFSVNGEQYGDLQYIVAGSKPTKPIDPTSGSLVFKGWSIDGTAIVDLDTIEIVSDTEFKAVFASNSGRPGQREDGNEGGSDNYDNYDN